MTKQEFIKIAEKKLGFKRYKDLLKEFGYSERVLDRFKYEEVIGAKITKKTIELLDNPHKPQENEHNEATGEIKDKLDTNTHEKPEDSNTGEVTEQDNEEIGIKISNRDYHAGDRLGSSKVKMILNNAAEFHHAYISKDSPKKYTDALMIGSLHHTLALEPDEFEKEYILMDSSKLKDDLINQVERLGGAVDMKQNKSGDYVVSDTVKTLEEKLNGLRSKEVRTIVTTKQLDIAKVTAEKALNSMYVIESGGKILMRNKLRDVLKIKTAYVERTFYGEIEGVKVQVRPDILLNLSKSKPIWFCIDLKTAADGTLDTFSKNSANYYFDIQEWLYTEVLRQNGIYLVDYRFCVAGKEDYSGCSYYQLHQEDVENAGDLTRRALQKYKSCIKNDCWEEGKFDFETNTFEPTTTVRLPAWRLHNLINQGVQ